MIAEAQKFILQLYSLISIPEHYILITDTINCFDSKWTEELWYRSYNGISFSSHSDIQSDKFYAKM